MEILGVPETDLRDNRPIALFEIDGERFATKLLPIAKAEAWLQRCAEADELDEQLQAGDRSVAVQYIQKILELVCDYNPEALPRDTIEAGATPAQLMGAFLKLRTLTDPFDMSQCLARATIEKQLGMLDQGLGKLTPEMMEMVNSRTRKRNSSAG